MRRLIMSRLIWIYAVWRSVFQLNMLTFFQTIPCLKQQKTKKKTTEKTKQNKKKKKKKK